MSLMEKRENSYTISTLFAFFHKVPGGVRCHWPLSFIPIGNGKLASAGEPPRFSIVAALLSVQPSASGGQCGFMTIGYTSPSPSSENGEGTGGGELRPRGTAHEVGNPTSIVGASRL